jgi:hypothetical protein
MPTADHFSADYVGARRRFLAAAAAAGAVLRHYPHPRLRGPDGEELAIDVARLGSATPTRALLLISGTHGVEGFCGSGCQVGYLVDGLAGALPEDAAVVLVHALNPYGFAHLRRVNEDGIDLNRNWIDFAAPPPSAAYEALHDVLVPADWNGPAWQAANATLLGMLQSAEARRFQAAVSGGQYSRPEGLFYGGRARAWSSTTLLAALADVLPSTLARLAVLDLHTGLGPSAYGEPILVARDAQDGARARAWYGPDVKDAAAGESVSAPVGGTVAHGLGATWRAAEFTYVALEFGTRPLLEVLNALRADHTLRARGTPDPAALAAVGRQMREAFYTESAAWQAAVSGRVADFAYRASRGLAAS